ncbi:MAG: 16S rRNA (uracil(1498)-N(3))-methyltransferase [Phaeodactylibacter sp.]|uniref:16S rRNA (uracil(1498)-N(3))-methyltransferase n=1 Tax=Phaeodactylibacter sp. TaxID=1940289 RepID=UPI0032ED47B8
MNIFFTDQVQGETAELPEEEARHCVQVLRFKAGDPIRFIDGQGGFYEGIVAETGKKRCRIRIVSRVGNYGQRPYRVHLAVAPTKNISRMEWLLEKATEIGLDTFTPLLCEHSERRVLKLQRLEKIALSAAKQSVKAFLPQLNPLVPFDAFLQQPAGEAGRYIAYLGNGVKGSLKQNYMPGQDVCLLIGPEGGFSPKEAEAAVKAGFTPVALGESRLRTETAALVACHTVHLLNA